jgi:hypothetical protein
MEANSERRMLARRRSCAPAAMTSVLFIANPQYIKEKIFAFKECNTTDAVRTIAASSQRQSGDKKCVEGF